MIDDFAFLEDWEDRYMHVIDLGKGLPPLPDDARTDTHKVKGCASQVWLVSERTGDLWTGRASIRPTLQWPRGDDRAD